MEIIYKLPLVISIGFCASISEVLEFSVSNSKTRWCIQIMPGWGCGPNMSLPVQLKTLMLAPSQWEQKAMWEKYKLVPQTGHYIHPIWPLLSDKQWHGVKGHHRVQLISVNVLDFSYSKLTCYFDNPIIHSDTSRCKGLYYNILTLYECSHYQV